MKRLKLTKDGAKEISLRIEKLQEELRRVGKYKGYASENEGDTWHDNFAFEQAEIQERGLIHQIKDLQQQLAFADIIEISESYDKVNIGSKVTVLMQFPGEEAERCTFTIDSNGDWSSNIISINSPLGECIFEKEVDYEGSYQVNGNVIKVKILAIER